MNGTTISMAAAAARFYTSGQPLPRYLSFRDFALMDAADFAEWCNGSEAPLRRIRARRAAA